MAGTPEKKVKNHVKKLLDEMGIYHFSPPGMGLGRAGIPDLICCYNGLFLAIECKAGKNKPTPLQQKELADIIKAGGVSCVINEDNMAELESILTTVMSKDNNDGLTGGRL